MTRLMKLSISPLASALILACVLASSFAITSHAGHIGASLISVASADNGTPAAAPPADAGLSILAYIGLAMAAAGGLLKIMDVALAGLKWLAPRTENKVDDLIEFDLQAVHDKLDGILKMVGGLVPAVGVPTSVSTAATVPAKTPQGGFARIGTMLVILACGALVACAALTADVKSFAGGVVTCAKADKAAVQALGLELGTKALAGALTGTVPWGQILTEAEAAGKTQGIDVAACSFDGLIADVQKLLAPGTAGTAVSALSAAPLEGLTAAPDPLDGGRASLAAFQATHGITRIVQ